jgi:peptidoglycan hydrolase-like protein with peptidoglycan-binding domain
LLMFSFLVPAISFAQVASSDIAMPPLTCYNIVNNLKYKDRDVNKNGEVTVLQNFLLSKKYMTVNATGYFGVLTLKGVKNFQRTNSISPTGFVGPITRAKIKSLTCPTPNSSSVTVVSPNGGESLVQGKNHTIKWTDSSMSIQADKYDIKLVQYISPSTSDQGVNQFVIAKAVSGYSYDWLVGSNLNKIEDMSGNIIPVGSYKIVVSKSGTNVYDVSDAPFNIVSNSNSTSKGTLYINPANLVVINGYTATLQAMYQPPLPACLSSVPACEMPTPAPYAVKATWTSSDTKIATVDYKDMCPVGAQCLVYQPDYLTASVKGITEGSVVITASYKDLAGSATSAALTANATVVVKNPIR